jgi:hypothetical protein
MTDYYPLIARAVTGLAKSTGESRRALYERARSALLAQLRNLEPPLAENEITRERLLLEEAIRKVEADTARQQRAEPPVPSSAAKERPARSPVPPVPEGKPSPTEPDASIAPAPGPQPALEAGQPKPTSDPGPKREDAKPAGGSAQWAGQFRTKDRERAQHAAAQALKGFRDIVAEVQGGAAPSENPPSQPAPEPEDRASRFAKPVHQPSEDFRGAPEPPKPRRPSRGEPAGREPQPERFEPRIEPQAPRRSMREILAAADEADPRMELPASPQRTMQARQFPEPHSKRERGGSAKAMIAAFLGVFLVVAGALALYWQRDRLRSILAGTPATQAQREAAPSSRPKISDRVGQAGQPSSSATAPGNQESAPSAAVAQRVVLYEEDPADAQGKRYIGSVVWRTEMASPGAGQPPELAVKGDLEIPERRVNMTISVRRNSDKALPASHTIEIMFNLPADFPFGGISNVPGILMKQAEQTRGSPLAGLAVKVTSGFFLIGLSASEGDMQRNLELLKDRGWFDIPLVYNNGRRAILAIEKGTPGERAFKDAFTAWGE